MHLCLVSESYFGNIKRYLINYFFILFKFIKMNKYEYKYRKYKEKYLDIYRKLHGGIQLTSNRDYSSNRLCVSNIVGTEYFEIYNPNRTRTSQIFCVHKNFLELSEDNIIRRIDFFERRYYNPDLVIIIVDNNISDVPMINDISYASQNLFVINIGSNIYLIKKAWCK